MFDEFKILLIDPGMRIEKFRDNRYVNRGLLSIATYLKSRGLEVAYFTFDEQYLDGIHDFGNIMSRLNTLIEKNEYHMAALSNLFIAEFPHAVKILREIKMAFPHITTVLGGYPATFNSSEIINKHPYIDFVIKGEGEWALLNLIKYLIGGKKDVNHLSGISYLDKEQEPIEHPSLPHGDLGQLVPIDYSLLPASYLKHKPPPNINIEFNRGCYFNCSFCSATLFWRGKIRHHPLDNIIKELGQLADLNYEGNISFEDETIDLRAKDFRAFLREVRKIEHSYSFDYIVTRYDFVDEESLGLLKDLGFGEIAIGLESASQSVLEIANKKIDLIEFKKSCRMIFKQGLNVNIFLIVGLPGESEDTFRETYDYISGLAEEGLISNLIVAHFQPYTCTKAYEDIKKYGGKIVVRTEEYQEWINRGRPLVEYPHLSRARLETMFKELYNLNKRSQSKFVERF